MYPLLFKPNLRPVIWGGHRLMTWKNLSDAYGIPYAQDDSHNIITEDIPIGESWEVSCIPQAVSIIANGKWKGMKLDDVIRSFPEQILGNDVVKHYGATLPLLAKFIDAEHDLSVQVHPDDAMAERVHGKKGKSEMWYIIDAKPGAYLYAGFKENLTKDEYNRRIADGSICEVMARHEVHTGDVFYLPAGRIHAICSGIMLAEIQQASDLTYRIYDYDRRDIDGKKRVLHTELASEALDYEVLSEYRTIYTDDMQRANPCIDSPFFSVRIVDFEGSFHRNLKKYGSFIISMCLQGDCLIKIRSTQDGVILREGHTCLIPAEIADYDVIPIGKKTKLLDAFIDNRERSILSAASRFLHLATK